MPVYTSAPPVRKLTVEEQLLRKEEQARAKDGAKRMRAAKSSRKGGAVKPSGGGKKKKETKKQADARQWKAVQHGAANPSAAKANAKAKAKAKAIGSRAVKSSLPQALAAHQAWIAEQSAVDPTFRELESPEGCCLHCGETDHQTTQHWTWRTKPCQYFFGNKGHRGCGKGKTCYDFHTGSAARTPTECCQRSSGRRSVNGKLFLRGCGSANHKFDSCPYQRILTTDYMVEEDLAKEASMASWTATTVAAKVPSISEEAGAIDWSEQPALPSVKVVVTKVTDVSPPASEAGEPAMDLLPADLFADADEDESTDALLFVSAGF